MMLLCFYWCLATAHMFCCERKKADAVAIAEIARAAPTERNRIRKGRVLQHVLFVLYLENALVCRIIFRFCLFIFVGTGEIKNEGN